MSDAQRIYGVVVGKVTDVHDPLGEGRVRLELPWAEGKNQSYWAPVARLMAGGDRGTWYMPEVGDEALVAFERGDTDHPYVIGYLWNGQDRPPSTDPQLRLIKSKNGHEIALYDPDVANGDTGYVRITDKHGNLIELKNAQIVIRGVASIDIQAPIVTINGRVVAPQPRPL